MFGFGKKKINDQILSQIMIEIGMFQSWTLENRRIDLNPNDLEMIIKRIFDREKLAYSDQEVTGLKFMVMSNLEFEQLRQFRKQTNFDGQVVGFCRSINLPPQFYTPTK